MENQKQPGQSDEIDLGRFFSKIGEGLQAGSKNLVRFLALLRRVPLEHKVSFITIILASVIIGVSYNKFLDKKYYESSMVLSSDYLNKRLVESMVEKLNLLASERNSKGLARALKLSDTLAAGITLFRASPFVAEADLIELEVLKEQLRNAQVAGKNEQVIADIIERIEIENRHAYEITVRMLSPSIITNLQDALVNYFRGNPYIQKRIVINRQNLLARQLKLGGDVAKLDSLKHAIYENYKSMATQERGSNTLIVSEEAVTNPIDIYNKDLAIYELYQEVTQDVYLQKDFEIVDGFAEFSEPSSATLPTIILYSLFIGIIAAYLEVAIRTLNSYLATVE